MDQPRSLQLRLPAWMIGALAVVWMVAQAWLQSLFGPVHARCGGPFPWRFEHTVVVVLALATVLGRCLLRGGPSAQDTIPHGRLAGGRRVALDAFPVITAALAMWFSLEATLSWGGCCGGRLDPTPWWSGWQNYASHGVTLLLALLAARKESGTQSALRGGGQFA